MDAPQAGHYWKTPFYWEAGCAAPPIKSPLTFEPVGEEWLRDAVGRVMAAGTDESDRYNVPRIGVPAAVQELYDLLPQYFERPETGTQNLAMVQAFRQAGYMERAAWQRPLA